MSEVRSFRRELAALEEVFAFSAESLRRLGLEPGLLPTVDFVLEELFTNMIKYSESRTEVRIEMREVEQGVEVTLDDVGVERFDVTARPPVDTSLPLGERQPGGLGLHLVARLVDSIDYRYSADDRRARITFRKRMAAC